ncbi:hypothetical protein PO909_028304 [Leuciscus waleckii]
MEGDTVALHTGLTEVQTGDVIDWRFGPNAILIARVNRAAGTTKLYDDVIDGRDRLYINEQVGDLIITNIRTEHSGFYKLSIHGRNKEMVYNVSVLSDKTDGVKTVSVMEGDSVILHTDVTEIQRYHLIQWIFENNSLIAAFNRIAQNVSIYDDVPDGRFRDRLKLDDQTGSLTITNTTTEHTGLYHLEIISSRHTLHKSFIVNVCNAVRTIRVNMGKPVTLDSGVTKIPKYVQLLWRFGDEDTLIEFNGTNLVFSCGGKFKDRIHYHENGSITINEIGIENSGLYHLEIISSRHTLVKRFNVFVTGEYLTPFNEIMIYILILFGPLTLFVRCSEIKHICTIKWYFNRWIPNTLNTLCAKQYL